ncbi:MAG: M56 family metallopeptidase, partial [Verrucomicrobiota bacterium]
MITSFISFIILSNSLLLIGLILSRFFKNKNVVVENLLLRATLVVVLIAPGIMVLSSVFHVEKKSINLSALFPAMSESEMTWIHPLQNMDWEGKTPNITSSVPSSSQKLEVQTVAVKPQWDGPLSILIAWGIGCSLFLLKLGLGHLRVQKWRKEAIPASYELQERTEFVSQTLGLRPLEVLHSPHASGPVLIGLLNPAILLPSEDQIINQAVLHHELGHQLRGDSWWLLFDKIMIAFHFYSPLAWIFARRQEESTEEVCDDFVLSLQTNAESYAKVLLNQAEQHYSSSLELTAIAMASFRSSLGRRVNRILNASQKISMHVHPLALTIIRLSVIGILGSVALLKFGWGENPTKTKLTVTTSKTENKKVEAVKAPENKKTEVIPTPQKEPEIYHEYPTLLNYTVEFIGPKEVIGEEISKIMNPEIGKVCSASTTQKLIKKLYATGRIANARIDSKENSNGII